MAGFDSVTVLTGGVGGVSVDIFVLVWPIAQHQGRQTSCEHRSDSEHSLAALGLATRRSQPAIVTVVWPWSLCVCGPCSVSKALAVLLRQLCHITPAVLSLLYGLLQL